MSRYLLLTQLHDFQVLALHKTPDGTLYFDGRGTTVVEFSPETGTVRLMHAQGTGIMLKRHGSHGAPQPSPAPSLHIYTLEPKASRVAQSQQPPKYDDIEDKQPNKCDVEDKPPLANISGRQATTESPTDAF